MAAQQGFQYEINASNVLKKKNFVPANFKPAGAGHDQPDLIIVSEGKQAGCELKITDASAGSLVIHFTSTSKSKIQWEFDPSYTPGADPEKDFIRGVAESVGLLAIINKKWNKVPNKVYKDVQSQQWYKDKVKGKAREDMYKEDLATFPELNGTIKAENIENYYVAKNTYYVNVGTHGFYLMGNKNPLKFDGVPRFSSSADAKWRARVQYKGGGNYQFTFEMSFKMRTKSPYNIAPINKGSVDIVKNKLILPV